MGTWEDWPSEEGFESAIVTATDGTPLRVVSTGPASGPRVVLLHGVPQHAYAWRHVMRALAPRFRVLAPDLRGIGTSEVPSPARYDLDQLASDVHSVRGDEPAILVGHDWGGVIAFYTAGRRPEGIRHLIVANGPHLAAYKAELKRPAQAIKGWYTALFQIPGIECLLRPSFATTMIRRSAPPGLFATDELERYRAPFERPGRIAATLSYYRRAAREVVGGSSSEPTILVPTTLVWGQEDKALAQSHPDAVRPYVASLQVRRLPGVSHWVPEERPEAIVEAIEEAERE